MTRNISMILVARKLALLLSGLTASGIAATILFAPDTFYSAYGIELAGNTNLINELKAPSGLLFIAGVLMLAGLFHARLTSVSLTAAAAVFLAFGLSRLSSMIVDGVPNSSLVGAAILEIAIGAFCLLVLMPGWNKHDAYTTD